MSKTAIKTILLSRNAYSWQYGGAERFTYNMAIELRKEGYRPVVVTGVPELIHQCHRDGIIVRKNLWLKNETRRRWALIYYALFPFLMLQYLYLMVRFNVSMVLSGSRDDQIFCSLVAMVLRKKAVWVDHADMKGIISQPIPFMEKSYYWAMAHATKIIAVSSAEKQKIVTNLKKQYHSKLIVINNGAHRPLGKALSKPAGVVITYVGRLEKDKGVFDLLEASRRVLKEHPEAVFWLVGKGQDEEKVRKIAQGVGPDTSYRFFGHVDSVGPILLASDMFVYPSHHDASPLAPIEALLSGLPVIATDVGGIPEVITRDCGILVPKNNPSALADALLKLLTDDSLRSRLATGARRQGERYEFGRVVTKHYLPLFQEVMSD